MTTWRTVPDTEVDQDSPGTVTLFTALRDNVAAALEGASGAPKIARKYATGRGTTVTFTGLSDFGGAYLELAAGGASPSMDIALDDGGGFDADTTLISSSADMVTGRLYVNTTTGAYDFIAVTYDGGLSQMGSARTTGTIAGGAASVDGLRLTFNTVSGVATIFPDGGPSAT